MGDPEEFLDQAKDNLNEEERDLERQRFAREDLDELQQGVKDIKRSIVDMNEVNREFKRSTEAGAVKIVGKFLAATTAVSVIFFFVSYALAKLVSSDDGGGGDSDDSNKKKIAVIKALTDLGKDIRNWSRVMSVWFTAHQSEKVKVGGVDVPLVDIFTNYTTPMNTVSY